MKRIKGVRQKQSGGYPTFVPLGTDGQFIDMISDLNLEYELKLGVKHVAEIKERKDLGENITEIIEHYATPQEAAQPGSFYSVLITIDGTGYDPGIENQYVTAIVESKLYWRTNGSNINVNPNDYTQKFIKGKHTEIWEITVPSIVEGEETYYNYDIKETYIDIEEDES